MSDIIGRCRDLSDKIFRRTDRRKGFDSYHRYTIYKNVVQPASKAVFKDSKFGQEHQAPNAETAVFSKNSALSGEKKGLPRLWKALFRIYPFSFCEHG